MPDITAEIPSQPIRIASPADLLAVVPFLLGYVPENSLVVIGIASPRDRVGVTLRYDLPDLPSVPLAAEIAGHAFGVLAASKMGAAVAVGYGPSRLVTPLADALRAAASPAGICLREVLRVQDGRYWSCTCTNPRCCPAEGTPFDTSAHPAASGLATLGGQVLQSRSDLAATVAMAAGEAGESMRRATREAEARAARLAETTARAAGATGARREITRAGLKAVAEAIDAYRGATQAEDDAQFAWLSVMLRNLQVRDDAWSRMDPEHQQAHLRLWSDLTRRARPGYVAPAASLLAFVAWQSGNGALANVALDRALADQPDYSMAKLLRQVINAGAPPSMARLPMTPEQVADSYAEADQVDDPDSGAGPEDTEPGGQPSEGDECRDA
jgi:Domain of unknown function (DUF4192)